MKYEIISFDDISDDREPSLKWCHETFSPVIGEIIYQYFTRLDFDVFNEYKEIIHSIENKKHLTRYEQVGLSKIKKQFWLRDDFIKNKKFFNPLVATPYNDKYLVHPGRDRYILLKTLGYSSYSFLVCDKEDLTKNSLSEIKSYHTPETIIRFNQNNFSTVTKINDKAYRDWL